MRWQRLVAALISGGVAAMPTLAQEATQKSEMVARTYSLAGTLAPGIAALGTRNGGFALIGVVVGPSLGHFYAHNKRRAVWGTLGRTGVMVVGGIFALGYCGQDAIVGDCGDGGEETQAVIIGTSALLTALAVLDIMAAPRSARRYNASHTPVAIDWRPPGGVSTPVAGKACVALCEH